MCVVAGLMVSWSASSGSPNRLYSFLRRILLVQGGPVPITDYIHFCKGFCLSKAARLSQENERLSEPEHFGVTLGSLWCHSGVTLGI